MSARKVAPEIRLDGLTLGYDGAPVVAGLSGRIAPGALLAVCGPNGAGKSTLFKALTGQLVPRAGAIFPPPAQLRQNLAYLPQAADLDRSFPIDVFDLAALGLWREKGLFGGFSRADEQKIFSALKTVGLEGFERRQIGALSGGQAQRLLFARLLLQDAAVLLLDEPFAAIDESTTADLLALIARWRAEGRSVIAVLHDFDMVRAHFPECLLLARRAIAWGPPAACLTPETLARARKTIEDFDHDALARARG